MASQPCNVRAYVENLICATYYYKCTRLLLPEEGLLQALVIPGQLRCPKGQWDRYLSILSENSGPGRILNHQCALLMKSDLALNPFLSG